MNPNVINILLMLLLSGSVLSLVLMYKRISYLSTPPDVLSKKNRNMIWGIHIFSATVLGLVGLSQLFRLPTYYSWAELGMLVPLTTLGCISVTVAWLFGPLIDLFLLRFSPKFREWKRAKRQSTKN